MKKLLYPELAAEMVRHNDTQREVAKLIGKTPNAVWRRITGRTDWSTSEIDLLCERYNMSYNELFRKNI